MTNDTNGRHDLPEGWVWTTLGTIRLDRSRAINPSKSPEQEFELYSVPAYDSKKPEFVHGRDVGSNKQIVETDTVLLCKINPRINRVWVVGDYSQAQKIASTEWIPFFKVKGINPNYLGYFMNTSAFRDFLAMNVSGVGGSLMRVRPNTISDYPFPLAPLPEQQRIVTEIEKQFTRLDAGITALKRAQANLKWYKAAVLKAACEGKLVEQDAGDEPASELLARILAERRAKWEADFIAKGKDPRKAKYEEPKSPDLDELPELPRGWCWATIDAVSATIGGVTKGRNFKDKKPVRLPYLRVANVQRGRLDLEEMKEIEVLEEEVEKYLLHGGDLVLTEGGDWDKLGRSAVWRNQILHCIHQNHIFRARLYAPDMPPEWLMYYTNSELGQAYFKDASKQTTNLASINLTQLRACPVPLPPLAEQRRIVAEVERRLSVVQELEGTLAANLARAERLRQAILKRAFEGRLVPQMTGHHENP
jgi:type I restriction enzyme S subunit